MNNLQQMARSCLERIDPAAKVALTLQTAAEVKSGACDAASAARLAEQLAPGRPQHPELVHYSRVPRRKLTTDTGRAAFLHAIAHIEFNAINLAWDAVCRFDNMPDGYYRDWSRVAGEEAQHFTLLSDRLQALGYRYGDFPAHDGLWEMATKTAHDILVRMALVPRVLEARGLDVTPGMIERLRAAGDDTSADVLVKILHDEIGHVEIGSRWFNHVCHERKLDPVLTFGRLLDEYQLGPVRKPMNIPARRQAGFSREEICLLEGATEEES
ncbi:MAG: ferritin-like domain-containing protein [Gammaproteobacteria bacterium]|nr:ferritin-like domain-containing protein [Gammaproteobacteria bacterium]